MSRLLYLMAALFLFSCENKKIETTQKGYTRSDCIVGLDFTGGVDSKSLKMLTNAIINAKSDGTNIAGITMTSSKNNYKKAFIQFNDQCENKESMTASFIENYWKVDIDYRISKDVVKPGVETIDLTGDSWIDQ